MEVLSLPPWAQRVVDDNNGIDLKFLTLKKLYASDLSERNNFLHLDEDVVEAFLIPYLTVRELARTWWISGGLNVSVYVKGGWRVELLLKRLEERTAVSSSERKKTVLKGKEMELLRTFTNFEEGDDVAIWMFRRFDNIDEEILCFLIVDV